MTTFDTFKLLPSILKELASKGYKSPTPIQEKSIPHLLEGKDLLGIAQTGTGKTAAFSLPMIDKLGRSKRALHPNEVRTLILTPTRELASQIELNIKTYAKGLNLRSRVIFGGVGKSPQISALQGGLDILIATPGRLLDLMSDGHLDFSNLEFFVLDEADTMLDMGFLKDVKRIISKLPEKRQTLLFSATMPKDIESLATSLLKGPIKVEVTPESSTVEKIEQKVYYVERENKLFLLLNLLEDKSIKSVLVFTKTKYAADRLVKNLEKVPIVARAIHSNKSQGARERSLTDFRSGKARVLVATDIAARGIDVSSIGHVINYNLPEDPKNYVHRIGRTARAGRAGVAISLCVASELPLLKNVEKTIKQKIPLEENQPFHSDLKLLPEHEVKKKTKKRPSSRRRRR